MKIKNKLRLGFGLLFVVVLLFGGISLYYMHQIAESSKVILKDNYESLNFSSKMRKILDENLLPLPPDAMKQFAIQLENEKNNITEKGEHDAVQALTTAFNTLRNPATSLLAKQDAQIKARIQLRIIEEINLNAVGRKYDSAQEGVQNAATYVILAAALFFLLLFSFIVNLPGIIAQPVTALIKGIREVSRKNYKHHLNFGATVELSELATEFNKMSAILNAREDNALFEIQSERVRIKTIIEEMKDAIIGVNEKEEIIFINRAAGQTLGLNKSIVVRTNIKEARKQNEWLDKMLADENLKVLDITVPTYQNQSDQLAAIQSGKNVGRIYLLSSISLAKHF